jgi:hypothetical protein
MGDPPGDLSGLLARQNAAANTVTFDRAASSAHFTVSFDDHLGVGHSDSESSALSGAATLFGRQQADGTADLLFEMNLAAADVTLSFDNIDLVKDIDVHLTEMIAGANLGDRYLHLDASGIGTIPVGALFLNFEARVDGKKIIIQRFNAVPIGVVANFPARTFRIPAFPASLPNVDVTIELSGNITNQPPRADAGPRQTLECTSPAGAPAVLRGTAFDPDQEQLGIAWHERFFEGPFVSHELQPTILARFQPPALTTTYELRASDAAMQTSSSETVVTVQDTTPPTVSVEVDADCLWAPNHKMILYELGKNLRATVADTCDHNPSVRVVSVVSDQPVLGGGSGNTTPDVLFGPTAFCARAERAGTIAQPRDYTIDVAAKDASNNEAHATAVVRVGHDQSGAKCPKIDSARIVDEGDPRCTR